MLRSCEGSSILHGRGNREADYVCVCVSVVLLADQAPSVVVNMVGLMLEGTKGENEDNPP